MNYCKYFQAQIKPSECWFFVAILRSHEHLAFDRTFDKGTSTFEFLVPAGHVEPFLALMRMFADRGVITNLTELPNRFEQEDVTVWNC